jgi:hypothetical protein
MKHLTFVAGVIALALSFVPAQAQTRHRTLTDHDRIAILQHRIDQLEQRIGKHAWPGLAAAEKAALTAVLKRLPMDIKFEIICNDAGCNELAMD